MPVVYGKFEMPDEIKQDAAAAKPNHARFIAGPFEPGAGHTVGVGLRRFMLSGLEAPAIVSVRMEGVTHEFMAVPGITEDVTNIVLNFKGALLRRLPMEGETSPRGFRHISKTVEATADEIKAAGQKIITLGDVVDVGEFEVVNPELELFTITQPMSMRIDLRVAMGRGYEPSERFEIGDKVAGEMVIDALFSPVRLVNYRVENTRVGQATDYDNLVLDVTTDGRITPQEALSFAAQIAMNHFEAFKEVEEQEMVFQREEIIVSSEREEVLRKLALRIGEIELSVRSTNCLNGAGIRYIGELATMKESEMLQFRNFGKKSLTEIRQKLEEMGLGFDVDLSGHGIDRDNVIGIIEQYLEEREAAEAEEGSMEESNEA